jgi:hypothetical protein
VHADMVALSLSNHLVGTGHPSHTGELLSSFRHGGSRTFTHPFDLSHAHVTERSHPKLHAHARAARRQWLHRHATVSSTAPARRAEQRLLSVRKVVLALTSTSAEIYLSMASAKELGDTRFILVPAGAVHPAEVCSRHYIVLHRGACRGELQARRERRRSLQVEDHVWFEDRWMVASLCDE